MQRLFLILLQLALRMLVVVMGREIIEGKVFVAKEPDCCMF